MPIRARTRPASAAGSSSPSAIAADSRLCSHLACRRPAVRGRARTAGSNRSTARSAARDTRRVSAGSVPTSELTSSSRLPSAARPSKTCAAVNGCTCVS